MKWRYPQLSFRPRWFGWKEAKPLAKFSGAVFAGHVAGLLNNDTDKVIAGTMLGPTAVAVYQIGYKLYDLTRTLFANSVSVIMPTAAALSARGDQDRLNQMLCQVSSVMVGVMAAVYFPLILYGGEFINLWVGPKFSDSAKVLVWLSLAILLGAHVRVLGSILWGLGDWKANVYPSMIAAFFNVTFSVLFCLRWGVIGIAAATALVAFGGYTWWTFYAIRKFGVKPWDFFGRAWMGSLLGMIVGALLSELFALTFSHMNFARWLCRCIVFEIGFWPLMFLFGLTPQIRTQFGYALLGLVLPKISAARRQENL